MSLASSDVPKDDAPARKSATSKKDSTKSFPKLLFEEAFARTDGEDDDENLLLRAARVKEEARASAAQLPARLDEEEEEEEEDATGRGEEEHRCWGRRCALMCLTFWGKIELTKATKKRRKRRPLYRQREREREKENKEFLGPLANRKARERMRCSR